MDEPFAALDEMTRDRLNEEIAAPASGAEVDGGVRDALGGRGVFLSTRIIVLAPNPGRIHAVFAVDLPVPRTAVAARHAGIRRARGEGVARAARRARAEARR